MKIANVLTALIIFIGWVSPAFSNDNVMDIIDMGSKSKIPNRSPQPFSFNELESVLFILDFSKSMNDKIGRNSRGLKIKKIDEAMEILLKTVKLIPENVAVGVRTFGLQNTYGSECQSTKLLIPLKRSSRRKISDAIKDLKPFGMTPLTFSLYKAIESDFKGSTSKNAIILLTDGVDTCGKNPVAYVRSLKTKNVPLIPIVVIGIDISRDNARKKLESLARTSGGRYYHNSDLSSYWNQLKAYAQAEKYSPEKKLILKMFKASEMIIIAKYDHHEAVDGSILADNPPRAYYKVIEYLKGPKLAIQPRMRYEFDVPNNKKNWKFKESMMPRKNSKWILFIRSGVPKEGILETYKGPIGRQKYSRKNMNFLLKLIENSKLEDRRKSEG